MKPNNKDMEELVIKFIEQLKSNEKIHYESWEYVFKIEECLNNDK